MTLISFKIKFAILGALIVPCFGRSFDIICYGDEDWYIDMKNKKEKE